MRNSLKIFALLAVALLVATSAFAASAWTQEDTYSKKVAGKLDYGVKNLLGGWLAVVPGVDNNGCNVDSGKEGCCPGVCCVKKMGMGLVNAVAYTVGGALNVATFPIPVDVPIPHDGIRI